VLSAFRAVERIYLKVVPNVENSIQPTSETTKEQREANIKIEERESEQETGQVEVEETQTVQQIQQRENINDEYQRNLERLQGLRAMQRRQRKIRAAMETLQANQQALVRQIHERNLRAEDLVSGVESIDRGPVKTSSVNKRDTKDEPSTEHEKRSNVRVDGKEKRDPTGKTTINLSFNKMLPTSYFQGCAS
jgi:uncharacterized protein YgiM (DUF1202 family)